MSLFNRFTSPIISVMASVALIFGTAQPAPVRAVSLVEYAVLLGILALQLDSVLPAIDGEIDLSEPVSIDFENILLPVPGSSTAAALGMSVMTLEEMAEVPEEFLNISGRLMISVKETSANGPQLLTIHIQGQGNSSVTGEGVSYFARTQVKVHLPSGEGVQSNLALKAIGQVTFHSKRDNLQLHISAISIAKEAGVFVGPEVKVQVWE